MIRRKSDLTGRVLVAALFLVFGAVSVNAYTLVMRDGRRVEIPDSFTVTSSTVTYEAGSAIQITVQLNAVDIAATERANNEANGSFLMKATAQPAAGPATQTRRSTAERSITNATLEQYRRARIENEKQRKELGLPSLEERRREVAAIEERTVEQVRNMRAQQALEQEAYWRGVAESMRAQQGANNGQRDFDRSWDDAPWAYSFGGFPGFFPFDDAGFGFGNGRGRFGRFGRFPTSDPFAGFLTTPITPFPRFPSQFRRPRFIGPRTRVNPRPSHGRFNPRR